MISTVKYYSFLGGNTINNFCGKRIVHFLEEILPPKHMLH